MRIIAPINLILALLITFFYGCGRQKTQVEGFKSPQWKRDKNGCLGIRDTIIDQLITNKKQLYKLTESELLDLLGQPDKIKLYKRGMKFYIYHIAPKNKYCDEIMVKEKEEPFSIQFRISALGLTNEIILQNIKS